MRGRSSGFAFKIEAPGNRRLAWRYRLRRAPERSRRNRRPHVLSAETPTTHAVARLESHPHGMRMQTFGEGWWLSNRALPEIAGRRHATRAPGFLERSGRRSGAAWVVGVGFKTTILKETDDTLACRLGVWPEQSDFSREKSVCEGHGLHEKGQISWLNARTRCPQH